MYEDAVKQVVEVLKKGGIILYPSDTIWGIGCDALNKKAIAKVFALKQRFERKNMIILVTSLEEAAIYVERIPDVVPDLINSFNRPLTVVYPGARNLPENLIAEDGSVGIRVVKNEFCETLIRALKKPLVSTSANVSGMPAPLTYSVISQYIINGVDYVVKIRQENVTEMKASTIVRVDYNNQFTIIRD